jgi:multisubunit Na+/H+ antiporter MnhE subunit
MPKNELFYAIYGNSITLTPGTVTVLVDEKNNKILTHALVSQLGHNLVEDVMASKIKEVLK